MRAFLFLFCIELLSYYGIINDIIVLSGWFCEEIGVWFIGACISVEHFC